MIPTSIPRAPRLAFLALIVVGGGLVVAPSTAVAAPDRAKSARAHLDTGTAYFNLEKYKEAIGEFEQAYLDKQDPAVFFHIGECHRLLGNRAEAIRFLRRFLQETRNHPSRVRAEDRLADLEAEAALPPLTAPLAPPSPPSAPPSAGAPSSAGTSTPVVGATVAPAQWTSPPPQSSSPASPSTSATFAPLPTATSAPGSTTTVAAMAAPAATTAEARPVYKKWWFWTLVGAVVVGGVVTGVAVTSAPMRPGCPSGLICQ